MRKICFWALTVSLTVGLYSCKQKTAGANSDNKTELPDVPKEFLVTEQGIDQLRIGMTLDESKKILGQDIPLTNADDDISWMDTVYATYNKIPMEIFYERQYNNDIDDSFTKVIAGFRVKSELCKTEKGIGVGSEKMDIINKYDGYVMNIYPEFEDTTYTTRSKTKSIINVSRGEDTVNMLIFSLDRNRVSAVELSRFFGEH